MDNNSSDSESDINEATEQYRMLEKKMESLFHSGSDSDSEDLTEYEPFPNPEQVVIRQLDGLNSDQSSSSETEIDQSITIVETYSLADRESPVEVTPLMDYLEIKGNDTEDPIPEYVEEMANVPDQTKNKIVISKNSFPFNECPTGLCPHSTYSGKSMESVPPGNPVSEQTSDSPIPSTSTDNHVEVNVEIHVEPTDDRQVPITPTYLSLIHI